MASGEDEEGVYIDGEDEVLTPEQEEEYRSALARVNARIQARPSEPAGDATECAHCAEPFSPDTDTVHCSMCVGAICAASGLPTLDKRETNCAPCYCEHFA